MKELTYKKGQIIFFEQDKCEEIGLVKKGCINIITYTKEGIEYLIKSVKENEYFGLFLLFSSSAYYQGNIIAQVDTTIEYYNKDDIFMLCQNKTFFNEYMMRISLEHLDTQKHYKIISQNKIKEKIIMYIKLENKDKNGYVHYSSLEILANYLGLPRPSLSRELLNLEKNNTIIRKNKAIKLL